MAGTNWSSVSLPTVLMKRLDDFSKTNEARDLVISSRSQIISLILRDYIKKGLTKLEKPAGKSIEETDVKILKNEINGLKDKLEKYKIRLLHHDLAFVTAEGGSKEVNELHGKNGEELLRKIDPENIPRKLIRYDLWPKKIRFKDNRISGLVTIQIRKNKVFCSHDKNAEICVHIAKAFRDSGFYQQVIMNDVKSPLIDDEIARFVKELKKKK